MKPCIFYVTFSSEETSIYDRPENCDSPSSQKRYSYIVFESALMLLFSTCVRCRNVTKDITKTAIGSFIRIVQQCHNCSHRHVWESQPFIGNLPAGNILTSAAILYSGSLPSKALRMFKILGCVTISKTTYYPHQSLYLQPSVSSTWEQQQRALLSELKDKSSDLVLGGDGRADSTVQSMEHTQ